MKLLCLILIYSFGLAFCSLDTFEFGVNEGRVSFTTSGKITMLEKIVRIPIIEPECTKLSYVRVDVDNRIGPPLVTLEEDVHTVVIKYRRLQYSRSSYVVTAKSLPMANCYKQDAIVTL